MNIKEAKEKRETLANDLSRLETLTRRVKSLRNNEEKISAGRFKIKIYYTTNNQRDFTLGDYSGDTSMAICNILGADTLKEIAVICAKHDIQWREEDFDD